MSFRDDVILTHRRIKSETLEIMRAKNQDYRGGEAGLYANFEKSVIVGVPMTSGLMVRMIDKHQRIRAFVSNGTLAVKGESFKDAIYDLHNYTTLLHGMFAGVTTFAGLVKHREVLYAQAEVFTDEQVFDDVLALLGLCEISMSSRVDTAFLLISYSEILHTLNLKAAKETGGE